MFTYANDKSTEDLNNQRLDTKLAEISDFHNANSNLADYN